MDGLFFYRLWKRLFPLVGPHCYYMSVIKWGAEGFRVMSIESAITYLQRREDTMLEIDDKDGAFFEDAVATAVPTFTPPLEGMHIWV